MTLQEIAEAVGGALHDVRDPHALISRPAVVDSRYAESGSLFVALPGAHTDGHLFARAAVDSGAVGVLAARPVGVPAVVVADVLDALARLARAVQARLHAPTVVALTGSVGKTSTKDLLAQLLCEAGATVATPLSFNNRIGLPLTVLRADAGTRYLVAEMGAGQTGDIAHLCGIVPPTVGLVTNVGTAHIGEFGGAAAIAAAKGELLAALPVDGLAVLNADDPWVMSMAVRSAAPVLTFGRAAGDVRAVDGELNRAGQPRFTLTCGDARAAVQLRTHGMHNIANAAAAAAVALGLGMDLDQVAQALCDARQLTPGRMEVIARADGVTIINDAFNANPDSMRAALAALAAIAGTDGRAMAVLGEMRELGAESGAYHAELGRQVGAAGVTRLVAVGRDEARLMHEQALGAGVESVLVPDRDAAFELLADRLVRGDVVLLKGSHSVGLEQTARALAAPGSAVASCSGPAPGTAKAPHTRPSAATLSTADTVADGGRS
jgi:UDP-N-acetylmuramoyl-tripeptide--D-alanyl-D-alanine ligase